MLGIAEGNQTPSEPSTYVEKLQAILPRIHDLARRNLQSSQMRQKRDYDLKLSRHSYQLGDLVYKIDSTSKVGQSAKLKQMWRGPLLVIKVISSIIYKVRDQKKESMTD
jgi:hypothetical protein